MPTLKVPTRATPSTIAIVESRIPSVDELIVLGKPLLDATVRIGRLLHDCSTTWAFDGDLAEILNGVNVNPDHVSILTSKKGCEEIGKILAAFQTSALNVTERQKERKAEINQKLYPVVTRSYLAGFKIEDQRLEVNGDLRIRVGDWEWGDPLEYEPEYVYVVGVKVPVVPLQLMTELYTGLGWLDRVKKIREALARRHHQFSP